MFFFFIKLGNFICYLFKQGDYRWANLWSVFSTFVRISEEDQNLDNLPMCGS